MPERTSSDDDCEVPPAVTCPQCRRAECAGCVLAVVPSAGASSVPWESARGGFRERLWRTALVTSTEAERTFGELPETSWRPALVFAVVAETFAIGSLAAAFALALFLIAPDLAGRVLTDASVLGWGVGLVLFASGLMVALHALWGVCLELGAGGGPSIAQGLRFGFYACGWDLLTSPAGIVHGLAARGLRGAWWPIFAAARVPRVALRAYLERCRKRDDAAQRRALKLSLIVIGGVIFLITAGVPLTVVGWFPWW